MNENQWNGVGYAVSQSALQLVVLLQEECASVTNRREIRDCGRQRGTISLDYRRWSVSRPCLLGLSFLSRLYTPAPHDKLYDVNLVADNISRRARSCATTRFDAETSRPCELTTYTNIYCHCVTTSFQLHPTYRNLKDVQLRR